MPEPDITILPVVSRESLLFRSLRQKGIEELQQIASDTWSDHNVHDPGISLHEAFCYIITEAANQLNFSFKDLIATAKGIADANINYPSAATNLPCKAVTLIDFRKIILDLPEIRNAYFDVTTDSKIAVFYDSVLKQLTYTAGPNTTAILWGGLYSIQLEMETDDLNSNTFNLTVVVGVNNIPVILTFKYWDEVSAEWFAANTITAITLEDTVVQLAATDFQDFYSEWTINFSDGSTVIDFPVWVKLVDPLPAAVTIAAFVAALQPAISATVPGSPYLLYKQRLLDVQVVVNKAHDAFLTNRNVGEDISLFTAMRLQEIAMDASVEITSVADPVEVFALIIFAIETFFSPRPGFQSLEQLLVNEDFKVEDVFLGPLLNSGFLSEDALNTLSKGNTIYVSDLIHLVLDVKGTATVRDLSLTTYFNNFEAIVDERNCLKIKKGFKPALSATKTDLVLTRNGIAISIDKTLVNARLTELRTTAAAGPGPGAKDLAIPFGNFPNIGTYRSVQYELPAIYGTGSAGISLSSPPERIAQLRQLQGYLFLFDQILANTFSQLANVGDLFAIRQQRSKTYYYQPLYNVPGAEDLIGYLSGLQTWEDFIVTSNNDYIKLLDDAGEPDDTFFQRRNLLLDYLLARTAENRQDYAAILTSLPGDFVKQIILHEKEKFLERYPALSMARAQAYNYALNKAVGIGTAPDVWDTDNVGGYVKMVCAKLGFVSDKERNLYHLLSENFDLIGPVGARIYRMRDNGGLELIRSQISFSNDGFATDNIKLFLRLGRYRENYEIFQIAPGQFSFKIVFPLPPDVPIFNISYTGAAILANEAASENVIQTIINIIGEKYTLEGIHVVEHILLRPRNVGAVLSDKLFKPLTAEDTFLTDPYSHVVTAALPSGKQHDFSILNDPSTPLVTGERLLDEEYKLFLQQTILREAPAHLLVNIFFLDIDADPNEALFDDRPSLQNFERKLKAWREAVADKTATIATKIDAQRKLVTVIEIIYGA